MARVAPKRLAALRTKDGRKFYKARVKAMTGFSEQKPGLVSPLRPEETECILSLTWQSWDWLLNHVFTAPASELTNFVIDPDSWVANKATEPKMPTLVQSTRGVAHNTLDGKQSAQTRCIPA